MGGTGPVSVDLLLAAADGVGGAAGRELWDELRSLILGRDGQGGAADAGGSAASGAAELAAVEGAPGAPEAAGRLAAVLAGRAGADAEFGAALGAWQTRARRAYPDVDGERNVIGQGATVYGSVLQARDVANLYLGATDAQADPGAAVFAPEQQLREDPPPSFLLRDQYEVVPFYGRGTELDELAAWCRRGDRVAIRLVTAAGGQGKTRLARELCHRHRREGWVVGFVRPDASPESLVRLLKTAGRYLLVVDYAETLPSLIRAIGRAWADTSAERIRLLLLARSAGDWWSKLREGSDDELAALLIGATELRLGPLASATADRRAGFDLARERFARRLGIVPFPVRPPPDLDQPRYGLALTLHMTALAMLLDGADQVDTEPAWRNPAIRVLDHERRYWRRGADAAGLDVLGDDVLGHIVAAATLFGAADVDAALRLLRALPDLSDQPDAVIRRYLRWARTLHPGPGQLNPLQPDLLGEDHVAEVCRATPTLVGTLVPVTGDAQQRQALTVLARTASRYQHVAPLLRAIVADHAENLLPTAVDVATQLYDPRPLADAIGVALPLVRDPLALLRVHEAMPKQTVALADLAVQTAQAITRLAEALLPADEPNLGGYLNDLAVRLDQAGELEQALEVADRAIEVLRSAPAAHPDQGLLGVVLITRGNQLYQLGRMDEARDAYREAVTVLDAEEGRETDLASALSMLAALLGESGGPEALALSERAVGILGPLAADGSSELKSSYAKSLINHADRLSFSGRHADAVDAATNAVRVVQPLVAARPDVFVQDMLTALDVLTVVLGRVGRFEEALGSTREAVDLIEEIAGRYPGRYDAGLHQVLRTYAGVLANLDRKAEAFATFARAVDICRSLVARRPESYLDELAFDLGNLTGIVTRTDLYPQALVILTETESQLRRLDCGLLEAQAGQRDRALAGVLAARCQLVSRMDDYPGAVAAGREAVELLRVNEAPQPGLLALAAATLAVAEAHDGDLDASIRHAHEAFEICESRDDLREVVKRNVAMLLDELASPLSGDGRSFAAREFTARTVKLMRELAARNPVYESDLAVVLYDHAVLLWGRSRVLTPWLDVLDEAIAIQRRWAGRSPEARDGLDLSQRFRAHALGVQRSETARREELLGPDDPGL